MPRSPLEGYDIFTRYEQICGAVTRAGVTRWIAIDDDPEFTWPEGDARLVRCNPKLGLGSQATQHELREKLIELMQLVGGADEDHN